MTIETIEVLSLGIIIFFAGYFTGVMHEVCRNHRLLDKRDKDLKRLAQDTYKAIKEADEFFKSGRPDNAQSSIQDLPRVRNGSKKQSDRPENPI